MGVIQRRVCACLAIFVFAAGAIFSAQGQRRDSAGSREPAGLPQPAKGEQLFALANATRAQEGRGRLVWDQTLAEASMRHCMRMAAEGPISHRYDVEPDLTARAADAGAHFSRIEENIAVGAYPGSIHQGWLDSAGHRANLLNPEVDHVGIAVVAAQGVLYAVADYARAVPVLTETEVEGQIGSLLRAQGIAMARDTKTARAACRLDKGLPSSEGGASPEFVMRWQDSDLDRLPPRLVENLASGRYRRAEVGSCPPHEAQGAFTIYRVAVLLY